jgi:hypothetical protein
MRVPTRSKSVVRPSEEFYVWGNDDAICLPNGNLRYFESVREAWAFLAEWDAAEINKIAA